jgi:hypothetical protein
MEMLQDQVNPALYEATAQAYGDSAFAAWICRGYPQGSVDLARAHDGYLLVRDGWHSTDATSTPS